MSGGEILMANAKNLIDDFQLLSDSDKQLVVQQLPLPTGPTVNRLWFVVVGTLATVLVGGVVLIAFVPSQNDKIVPIVTSALTGLLGLLAPSPAMNSSNR
jgi:hypothetical protein